MLAMQPVRCAMLIYWLQTTKRGHVTQLWHLKTSWIDVMDGVSLIEGLQMVFKDIVNTSLLTLISIVISVSLATTITRGTL